MRNDSDGRKLIVTQERIAAPVHTQLTRRSAHIERKNPGNDPEVGKSAGTQSDARP
jgi:hypothetical protein